MQKAITGTNGKFIKPKLSTFYLRKIVCRLIDGTLKALVFGGPG